MADNGTNPVEIDGMLCYPKGEEPAVVEEERPVETCPKDPRFQQVNVTRWCYQMFVDYHRCMFLLSSQDQCDYFKRCYTSICPNAWVESWEEQISEGRFPREYRCDYYYRGV